MSEFTGGGKNEQPSLYNENNSVRDFSDYPNHVLVDKFDYYCKLDQKNMMPRALASRARILLHLQSEIDWRANNNFVKE